MEKRGKQGAFVSVPENSAKTTPLSLMGWLSAEDIGQGVSGKIRESFEQANPQIDFKEQPVCYDQIRERLTEMIGAGRAPDVVQIHSVWTSSFASMNAFCPVKENLPPDLFADHLSRQSPENRHRGTDYSITWMLQPTLLFCNRVVMKEAGLDPDRPPLTLEELRLMTETINGKSLSIDGEPVVGFAGHTTGGELSGASFLPLLFSFGGSLFNAEGGISLHSSEALQALEYCRQLLTSSGRVPRIDKWEVRKRFAQNRAAFMFDGSAGRSFYRRESGMGRKADEQFQAVPVPVGAAGCRVTIAANHSLAVLQQSSAIKESFALVAHLLSDRDIARELYEAESMLPAGQHMLALPEYNDPYARLIRQEIEHAQPLPTRFPCFPLGLNVLGDGVIRFLTEDVPAGDVLDEVARMFRTLLLNGTV
jgi:multiple sugar transport system substrate-binding protein